MKLIVKSRHSPAFTGGVVFCAACLTLLTLGATTVSAEVFVSTQRVAERIGVGDDLSPDAARSAFDRSERPLLVVHVGHGRRGYDRGHLPGAVYLDFRTFYVERDGLQNQLPDIDDVVELLAAHGIGPDTDLLLYGDAAGILPARVYAALAMVGLDGHAWIMDGQLRRWVKEGRPVSTEPVEPTPIGTYAVLAPGRVLRAGAPHPAEAVYADARSAEQFAGVGRIRGIEGTGRRPGPTLNLPWRHWVPDIHDPVLVLEGMDASVLPTQSPVVVYDERGNQASVVFAVLRHLGVDAWFDEPGVVGFVRAGGELVADRPEAAAE